MLGEVLRLYCQELFTGELEHFSVEMQDMQEEDIQPEKAAVTMDLIIALHQNFLYEAYLRQGALDPEAHEAKFNELLEYLLSAGR